MKLGKFLFILLVIFVLSLTPVIAAPPTKYDFSLFDTLSGCTFWSYSATYTKDSHWRYNSISQILNAKNKETENWLVECDGSKFYFLSLDSKNGHSLVKDGVLVQQHGVYTGYIYWYDDVTGDWAVYPFRRVCTFAHGETKADIWQNASWQPTFTCSQSISL